MRAMRAVWPLSLAVDDDRAHAPFPFFLSSNGVLLRSVQVSGERWRQAAEDIPEAPHVSAHQRRDKRCRCAGRKSPQRRDRSAYETYRSALTPAVCVGWCPYQTSVMKLHVFRVLGCCVKYVTYFIENEILRGSLWTRQTFGIVFLHLIYCLSFQMRFNLLL